jgi:hypothetical protein
VSRDPGVDTIGLVIPAAAGEERLSCAPMARVALLSLVVVVACRAKNTAPAPVPAPAPAARVAARAEWPATLTDDLSEISIARRRGDEPLRAAQLSKRGTTWVMTEPFTGAADPDAMASLLFALRIPAGRPAAGPSPADAGRVAFDLKLTAADGGQREVRTFQVPLGSPVIAEVEGVGTFVVSAAELANAIPDPSDFAPAGLWTDAPRPLTRLMVRGPKSYELTLDGGAWLAREPTRPEVELEDVPGIIVGREATGHYRAPLQALGLAPPRAVATLCAGSQCREFRFGTAEYEGRTGWFAAAPGADPIAIHPPDWDLIVNGPFPKAKPKKR